MIRDIIINDALLVKDFFMDGGEEVHLVLIRGEEGEGFDVGFNRVLFFVHCVNRILWIL